MAIKKGDRLIMSVEGVEVRVEAASNEEDGLVVVNQRGTFSQCPVANLRPDQETDEAPAFMQITGNQPDPSEQRPHCPMCGETSRFVPPNWVDHYRRVLLARFICSNKHQWTQEYQLK